MTASASTSAVPSRPIGPFAGGRIRWFHWLLLAVLLLIGADFRFTGIGRQSVWLDEYWTLYLATGRGNQLFDLPNNAIIDSPPDVGFTAAPAPWRIWTGLSTTTHPPLYMLALRAWVDVFGDSDAAIRSLSAVCSLLAVVVIFFLAERIAGAFAGICAAGIMGFSPSQIDFSQSARPYTLLVLLALLLATGLICVQQSGPTRLRLLWLAVATCALALTHYFSIGVTAAALLYAVFCLSGKARKRAAAAILLGLLVAALAWGPELVLMRHAMKLYANFYKLPNATWPWLWRAAITTPAQLFLGGDWSWQSALPIAVLVYLMPPLLARRAPEMIFWWLWIAITIGMLLALDIARKSGMLTIIRYPFIISPAIYLILATGAAGRWQGKLIAGSALLCALIFGIDRFQVGFAPMQDLRGLAGMIDQYPGPNDVIAFAGQYPYEPNTDYFVMSHYLRPWRRPVIFLTEAPSRQTLEALRKRPGVWMIGRSWIADTQRLLPGFIPVSRHGLGVGLELWQVRPAGGGE
jgi:uncharacterized membrane protein